MSETETAEGDAADAIPDRATKTSVPRDTDGDPLGCELWLRVEDLRALGVDEDTVELTYWAEPDGTVRVVPGGGGRV